ncbi:hypothetical protein ACO0LF_17265 [Undibacterium sp. Di27W]|uniref:hypothetical protein n=1 Tax=Undibacterium sp. Di27W TaxID=3413036 RepID=UPI003BF15618
MLLLSGKHGSGINILYPLIGEKWKSEIRVIEWQRYRRLLPFYIGLNFILSTAYGAALFGNIEETENLQEFLAYAPFFQIAYLFWRTRFGRKIIVLSPVKELTKQLAPFAVWLDYISISVMLILITAIAFPSKMDGVTSVLYMAIQLFFALFAILPLLNYLSFKKTEKKYK